MQLQMKMGKSNLFRRGYEQVSKVGEWKVDLFQCFSYFWSKISIFYSVKLEWRDKAENENQKKGALEGGYLGDIQTGPVLAHPDDFITKFPSFTQLKQEWRNAASHTYLYIHL